MIWPIDGKKKPSPGNGGGRLSREAIGENDYFRAAAIFSFSESSPTAPTTSSEPIT
jgi:hypothetical protein